MVMVEGELALGGGPSEEMLLGRPAQFHEGERSHLVQLASEYLQENSCVVARARFGAFYVFGAFGNEAQQPAYIERVAAQMEARELRQAAALLAIAPHVRSPELEAQAFTLMETPLVAFELFADYFARCCAGLSEVALRIEAYMPTVPGRWILRSVGA
ncbi:MAG: hypothetical protein ACJAYU_000547 [Bradymonadia bacterium]|jgi:hypothetical protein